MFKTILATTFSIAAGVVVVGVIGGILGFTASIAADKYKERKSKKLLKKSK